MRLTPTDWTVAPMGMTETPQWLVPAFVRSAKAIGATAPAAQIEQVANALVASWRSPDRFHHALRHLVDVLASVDQLAEETHDADIVRVAAWYHGAEFAADRRTAFAHKGGEDPIRGAARARNELPGLGIPSETVERVAELQEQMHRHSAGARDLDAQALCDADLAALAADPQRYREYRRNVRAEYAHIEPATYLEARIAILRKLAARPRIFASPMAQDWEEPARENLAAELEVLESELTDLEEAEHASATEASGAASATGATSATGAASATGATGGASTTGDTSGEKLPEGQVVRRSVHTLGGDEAADSPATADPPDDAAPAPERGRTLSPTDHDADDGHCTLTRIPRFEARP